MIINSRTKMNITTSDTTAFTGNEQKNKLRKSRLAALLTILLLVLLSLVLTACGKNDSHSPGAVTRCLSFFKRHFYMTFISERRYILFVRGLLTTLLITLLSGFFGSLFGFVLFVTRSRASLAVRTLTGGFITLISSMPPIIFIMLVYYSYYKNMYQGGLFAAIFGFLIIFGTRVYHVIKKNALTIDEGKFERSYRLEEIDEKVFFSGLKKHTWPSLKADFKVELIEMIKHTSVLGFISVMDLTHAFDTIRKDSMEIMVPLFITALVYFIIIRLTDRIL